MDIVVIANIVDFIPFRHRNGIRQMLSGYISPEDATCIFEINPETIRPEYVAGYFACYPGYYNKAQAAELCDVFIRRKIFLSYSEWNNITNGSDDDDAYYRMIKAVRRGAVAWFMVSPWRVELHRFVTPATITDLIPLKYVPLTDTNISKIIDRYRARFTATEIIDAHINSCKTMSGDPDIDGVDCRTITRALRLGLWKCSMNDAAIHRLILANPDELFNELYFPDNGSDEHFSGSLSSMHSYILAHVATEIPDEYHHKLSLIMSAPDSLVIHAHKLFIGTLRRLDEREKP